jgi:hypothetical protein
VKHILLVLTIALVMAAMLVVTAAPAVAAPPFKEAVCLNPGGSPVISTATPPFGELGKFQGSHQATHDYDCERSTTPNIGPPS